MLTGENGPLQGNRSEADSRPEIESLRLRNAELERAADDLQKFVFSVGHDLREPLRTITSYAQLLANKCAGFLDAEGQQFLANVLDASSRMGDLLSDLSAYASVTASPESTEVVDLNAVVEKAKQNLKGSIVESQALISSEALPSLEGCYADFVSLFQNLLSNAIKYRNGLAPQIHITAQPDSGKMKFAVTDNGIGVDSRYHQYIFEPFRRVAGTDVPGSGLGLAICQRVVSRYAGKIWVESREGQGATFVFTLPASCFQTKSF